MSNRFAIYILALCFSALVAEIPTCNGKGEQTCGANDVVGADVNLADMGIDEFGVQLVQKKSMSKRFQSQAVEADDKDEGAGKADEVVKVDEAAQAAKLVVRQGQTPFSLGPDCNPNMQKLLDDADVTGDGKVDIKEAIRASQQIQGQNFDRDMAEFITDMDKNGDGYISCEEMTGSMEAPVPFVDPTEAPTLGPLRTLGGALPTKGPLRTLGGALRTLGPLRTLGFPTAAPTTGAPVATAAPTSAAPTSVAPATAAPTTAAPTLGPLRTLGGALRTLGPLIVGRTQAPTTAAPTGGASAFPTAAPTTGAPTTAAPTTAAPTTAAPTTAAPTTGAPTGGASAFPTAAPTTGAPTTAGPIQVLGVSSSAPPTTAAPTTAAPTTAAPTTAAPTTGLPYTCAPLDAEFWYNPYETDRSYSAVYLGSPVGTGYARSMLDSDQAWSCGTATAGCYLIMDVGKVTQIKGTLVQGRKDNMERVAWYRVDYSTDGVSYGTGPILGTDLRQKGKGKWEHLFPSPLTARYLKIVTVKHVYWPSMRAGAILVENTGRMISTRLYDDGTRAWNNPPDKCATIYYDVCEKAREYSSTAYGDTPGIGHAQSMLSSPKAWVSSVPSAAKEGEWMIMDLGSLMWALGVITTGRADDPNYFTREFWTTVSLNKRIWYGKHVCPAGGNDKKRECWWGQAGRVRYIKLVVTAWSMSPSMRAGAILCGTPGKDIAAR